MVQERVLYTLWERGDIGGRSCSSSRTVWDPYNAHAAGLYALAFGSKWGYWALHAGVGSYTPALGSRRRCWSSMLAFGSKRRCWVVHTGVGSYTLAFGPTQWCWAVHVGVGPDTPAYSSWRMGSWEGMVTAAKQGRRHNKTHLGVMHSVPVDRLYSALGNI